MNLAMKLCDYGIFVKSLYYLRQTIAIAVIFYIGFRANAIEQERTFAILCKET